MTEDVPLTEKIASGIKSLELPLGDILQFLVVEGLKPFVTGGAVRDIICGRDISDIDIVIDGDPLTIAGSISKKISLTFFILDKKRGTVRLLKRDGKHPVTIDISPRNGKTVKEDLLKRDFTINAIAVTLGKDGVAKIYDPLDGISDIKNSIIRPVGKKSFEDDPVRVVRYFRFTSQYGLSPADGADSFTNEALEKLCMAPAERITQELLYILNEGNSYETLSDMDRAKVLHIIFPELSSMKDVQQNKWHHLDVFDHSMETLRQLEKVVADMPECLKTEADEICADMNSDAGAGFTKLSAVKLCALYHDSGKPLTKNIDKNGKVTFYGHEKESARLIGTMGKRLRLPNYAKHGLTTLALNHLRPLNAISDGKLSTRSMFRYVRDLGDEWFFAGLMLAISDAMATCGSAVTKERRNNETDAIKDILTYKKSLPPAKKLLNGHEVMEIFQLPSGKTVGKALALLDEAISVEGVKTRGEAIEYLSKKL